MKRAQTKTGDIMHVSECSKNEVTYGVILITLKRPYANVGEAGRVLSEFINQLQSSFGIQHTTGAVIACNHFRNSLTLVDYWQDVEKKDWKVKGWTDGGTIGVVYIKNICYVAVERETYFFGSYGISAS
jgi:hypothetical protein